MWTCHLTPRCYISLDSEAVEVSGGAAPEPIPTEHTGAGAPEEPDKDTCYPDPLKDSDNCLSHMVTRCF
jgi:hypothetical protein